MSEAWSKKYKWKDEKDPPVTLYMVPPRMILSIVSNVKRLGEKPWLYALVVVRIVERPF